MDQTAGHLSTSVMGTGRTKPPSGQADLPRRGAVAPGQIQCTVQAADVNWPGGTSFITDTSVYRFRCTPHCRTVQAWWPIGTPFRPVKFVINCPTVARVTKLIHRREPIGRDDRDLCHTRPIVLAITGDTDSKQPISVVSLTNFAAYWPVNLYISRTETGAIYFVVKPELRWSTLAKKQT